MLAQSLSPFAMTPESLDEYLSNGWFRMGQTIFTTNFLHFKDDFYSAIWLRIDLRKFEGGATVRKILKQNSRFEVIVRPAIFDESKEELYKKYRNSIVFDASSSVHQLMFGSASFNIYTTYELCVFDNEKLIGCGFFDIGQHAAAGISSFYDPEYKKFSLGKFIILGKIHHCLQIGLRYFYPGYFVPGYNAFDYKLELASSGLEFLEVASGAWYDMAIYNDDKNPYKKMQVKLDHLKKESDHHLSWKVWHYAYFDANILIDIETAEFLDYPLFLAPKRIDDLRMVVVYNVIAKRYDVVRCQSFLLSNPAKSENVLSTHLLRKEQTIFSSEHIHDIVDFIWTREVRSLGN